MAQMHYINGDRSPQDLFTMSLLVPFRRFSPLEGLFWPQIPPLTHDPQFQHSLRENRPKLDGIRFYSLTLENEENVRIVKD